MNFELLFLTALLRASHVRSYERQDQDCVYIRGREHGWAGRSACELTDGRLRAARSCCSATVCCTGADRPTRLLTASCCWMVVLARVCDVVQCCRFKSHLILSPSCAFARVVELFYESSTTTVVNPLPSVRPTLTA